MLHKMAIFAMNPITSRSWAGSVSEAAARGEQDIRLAGRGTHYASAFDREVRDQLGRRAPLLGPLRIWHKIHMRSHRP